LPELLQRLHAEVLAVEDGPAPPEHAAAVAEAIAAEKG